MTDDGPASTDSAALWARHRAVMPHWMALYYDQPLALVSGHGRHVTDLDGRTYLDFFAGILTNALGYDVAEINEAIRAQVDTGILHTSTLYLIEQQVALAEQIAGLSGIEDAKVFFTTSGTEANEAALLLAMNSRSSHEVLALRNSYHGRSFSTMGITGNRGWSASAHSPVSVAYVHGGYRTIPPFHGLSDADYIEACVADLRHVLDTATSGDVACMIVEPIQGVGGFTMAPKGLFRAFKEVLDEHGILLISDEVQTGWGRTGDTFWGIEAHGVTPDAMTFAKGLGNGLAIGGVVARAALMDGLTANSISTFGGNPLATAGAKAALDYLLDHHLQANAAARGSELLGGVQEMAVGCSVVREVRGRGLMIGIELVDPGSGQASPRAAAVLLQEARDRGLLVGKGGLSGNVVRLAPPMTLTAEEVGEGLDALRGALPATRDRMDR